MSDTHMDGDDLTNLDLLMLVTCIAETMTVATQIGINHRAADLSAEARHLIERLRDTTNSRAEFEACNRVLGVR